MRKYISGQLMIFLIAIFSFQLAMSQESELNDTTLLKFEEFLVERAIEYNPDIDIILNNQKIAKYNMQKSRWNWLNQLQLQGNLNEFTLDDNAPGADAMFFPRYNISLTVPLGVFGTRASEVRIAKKEFESTDYELMRKQIEIRKQVLTLYGNYILYQELLNIQIQRTEDEYVIYKATEGEFSNQQATIEDFKIASNNYNAELEKKYSLQYEQQVVRITLESLIGMTLEEAEELYRNGGELGTEEEEK